MAILERLAARLGYRKMPTLSTRAFAAAQSGRLTASWSTANTSFDYDLRASLEQMRARSRNLAQNNDYARRFLQMCATHIVGPSGFALQNQAKFGNGNLDTGANDAVERAFADWGRRGTCEATGRLSFVDVQQLLIETAPRDGEFLVRKVYGRGINRYNFAIQVLDVDRLDVKRNETYPDGRRCVMGVELAASGRPLAYWLTTNHPASSEWQTVGKYERVPASDIYHAFRAQRPEQTRGCPWMHTAMVRLQHLGAFEEAAVIAARVGASKMGWFTTPDGDTTGLTDTKGADEIPYMEAEPGQFGVLPGGMDFKSFDPDYPHAAFDPFIKATLRGIASGLGVAYHTLANDLEGVNFSSARAGTLEERDNWMSLQTWFAESFLYPLFSDWLRQALLAGAIQLPNGTPLPLDKIDLYDKPLWQGRRWQWVDPSKDIEANLAAIEGGLKSRRDVIQEQGRDLDDVWLQLQAENEKAAAMGIDLSAKPATTKGVPNEQPAAA